MSAKCERLPEPGPRMAPDDLVDDERCSDTGPHEDHFWSTEAHLHRDYGFACVRYCDGIPS